MPPPESLADQTARLTRTVKAPLTRTLVSEAAVAAAAHAWRHDGERATGVFITDAGRTAIGIAPAPVSEQAVVFVPVQTAETAEPTTKLGQVLGLLRRDEGATLAELAAVTGWLPRTIRAALTRLRQKGHVPDKGKRGDLTRHTIVETA